MSEEKTKIIQVSQETETPLASIENEAFLIRYLSYQSREGRNNNQPSQDYITAMVDKSRVVFAVCDGVGGSFVGNIASKFLGDKLVEYLWNIDPAFQEYWFGPETKLKDTITKSMRTWVDQAQTFVRNYIFPVGIPELHKKGLEALRDEQGSEAVFTAGIINTYGNDYSILTISAGDVEYALYDRKNVLISSNKNQRNNNNRWSTRWGFKGEINIHRLPPNRDFARLIVFTDGINGYEKEIDSLATPNVENIIEKSIERNNDDISIIEILLKEISHEQIEKQLSNFRANELDVIKLKTPLKAIDGIDTPKFPQFQFNGDLHYPEILKIDINDNPEETKIIITLPRGKPRMYEFDVSPTSASSNPSKIFTAISGTEKIVINYSGKYSSKGDFYIRGRAIHNHQKGEWNKPMHINKGKQRLYPRIVSFEEDGYVALKWREFIDAKHYELSTKSPWSGITEIMKPSYQTEVSKVFIRAALSDGSKTEWEDVIIPHSNNYFSTIENALKKIVELGQSIDAKYPILIRIGYFKDNQKWKESVILQINHLEELSQYKYSTQIEKEIYKILDKNNSFSFICYDRFKREYRLNYSSHS